VFHSSIPLLTIFPRNTIWKVLYKECVSHVEQKNARINGVKLTHKESYALCSERDHLLYLDHAEEVAVGVLQHTKIVVRVIRLGMTLRPDSEQSVHFILSVVGVEVEVQPIPA
jgi:hypothetical protein